MTVDPFRPPVARIRVRAVNLIFACLLAGLVIATSGCRCAAPAPAETSVKPGINSEFVKPDLQVTRWVERFEKEGREIYDHREAIVKALGLRRGMSVADIGAGTGLFTPLFSKAVGAAGTVYAVDIAPDFVRHIEERAAAAGMRNVRAVLCTDRSVELPRNSVDVAFICDTYHHFEFPQSTMASLHRALRPGGEVFVVDFKRIPGVSSDWILNHVRAGQEVFEREVESVGFRKVGEIELLKENYFVRFRKIGR
jgi:ubiquinone/menaquinone biosynthesis C-methylase UbiE